MVYREEFKKLTAAFTAAVMALSMVTITSAEDVFTAKPPETANVEAQTTERFISMGIIFGSYTNNSYYSKNGQACTCHDWCNWNVSYNPTKGETCNCINYDNSIQCVAFAKFIFYHARLKKWDNGEVIYKDVSVDSANIAKNCL